MRPSREGFRHGVLVEAVRHVHPWWNTPERCAEYMAELAGSADALLNVLAPVVEEMHRLEGHACWASVVEARGDEDAAGHDRVARWGGRAVIDLHDRLHGLTDQPWVEPEDYVTSAGRG